MKAKVAEPMCASCGRAVRADLAGHVEEWRDAGHRTMPYNAADPYRDSMSGTTLPLRGGMVGDRASRTTVVVPMRGRRAILGSVLDRNGAHGLLNERHHER